MSVASVWSYSSAVVTMTDFSLCRRLNFQPYTW